MQMIFQKKWNKICVFAISQKPLFANLNEEIRDSGSRMGNPGLIIPLYAFNDNQNE